jgi:hypothetical protein
MLGRSLSRWAAGRGTAGCGWRRVRAAGRGSARRPTPAKPDPPQALRARGRDWLEHSKESPLYAAAIPPGASRAALIGILDSAVEHQQPTRVAAAIARDSVRLFAVTRDPIESVTPISRWQFQTWYPVYPPWVTLGHGHAIVVGVQKVAFGMFHFRRLGRAQVDRPVAAFLRSVSPR